MLLKEFIRAGVGTRSRLYDEYFPIWEKCRDVVAGEEKVKGKREIYLPKADGMEDSDYEAYLSRTEFFNATGRTLDGLHGMMFRKPPIIECDDKYRQYLDNVDCRGNSIEQFISDVAYESLMIGWGGVLVDLPAGKGLSQKDARENEAYPYMTFYKAEDIINNKVKQRGRKEEDSMIVLEEQYQDDSAGEFDSVVKTRYRVLDVIEDSYRQRVFSDSSEVIENPEPMKKNRQMLHGIPFWWVTSRTPEKPLLLDLVNVNLSWYRKCADYENALHYGATFMPYTVGYTPPSKVVRRKDPETGEWYEDYVSDANVRVKCNSFTHFPEGTVVGSLEFDHTSSTNSSNAMQLDEARMAILGARIISAEKKGVESAETARIHRAGENSVLSAFANHLSLVMTKIVKFYLELCTLEEDVDVKVRINTDYDVSRMSPAEVANLVQLWQSGGIAKKDLFYNLKEGEIIPPDRDYEEMQAEIQEEGNSQPSVVNEE